MSYHDPEISVKLDDSLFWYMRPDRVREWGFRAKDQHEKIGFESQHAAYKAFRAYVSAHPGLSEVVSRLPRGSEICVDFDGTIYPGGPGDQFIEMQDPDPICVQTLQQLHYAGHRIIIYSCRANITVIQDNFRAQIMVENMEKYLRKHDIPYEEIHLAKPNYSVVIDDRAIRFSGSWAEVREGLEMPSVSAPSSQE